MQSRPLQRGTVLTVWAQSDRPYPDVMEQDTNQESMTELLAHAGIVVTDEGLARARRRLAEARARRDPAKLEALRRQFGLGSPPA